MNDITLDQFFAAHHESRRIFDALHQAIEMTGPSDIRVSTSQVAFMQRTAFARVWMPDQYLGGGHAPLVLTLSFRRRNHSPRWKQIVEPAPGRFTHHLELHSVSDVDHQVRAWLGKARDDALRLPLA